MTAPSSPHRLVSVKRSSSEAALSSAFVISARSRALSSRSFSLALVALSRPRRSLSMLRAAYLVGKRRVDIIMYASKKRE